MAYEALEPVREVILAKRAKGPDQLTLAQLTELLKAQYGVVTTPGTLSRYLEQDRFSRNRFGIPLPSEQ
jgi:hypothetical protein